MKMLSVCIFIYLCLCFGAAFEQLSYQNIMKTAIQFQQNETFRRELIENAKTFTAAQQLFIDLMPHSETLKPLTPWKLLYDGAETVNDVNDKKLMDCLRSLLNDTTVALMKRERWALQSE